MLIEGQHLIGIFMKNGFLFTCLLLGLCCTACIERSILLPEEPVPPRLVVLAYLVDGLRMEVYVSKLLPFSQDSIEFGVPDAEVLLYKNGIVETQMRHIAITNCNGLDSVCVLGSSKHISDDTLHLEYGATYHIEVNAPGFPSVFSESIVADQHLDGFSFDLVERDSLSLYGRPALLIDTLSLEYRYSGNPQDRLYLFSEEASFFYFKPEYNNRNRTLYDPRYHYALALSPLSSGLQEFVRPGSALNGYGTDAIAYPFSLHVARYPADYLRFLDIIQAQDNDVSGVYATSPVPIPTNMVGGEGYFVIIEHYDLGQFLQ